MKILKLELRDLDNKIQKLTKQRTKLVDKIQSKCKHLRIKKGGGGMWHEWPDYGYYATWYECLDCGKFFVQGKIKWAQQEALEKNIIEDTSD